MVKFTCCDCDESIIVKQADQGDIVSCPTCGLEHEVDFSNNGMIILKELIHTGEDWGE